MHARQPIATPDLSLRARHARRITAALFVSQCRGSYMKIAEANGSADPNKIRVGQELKIPGTTKGPEATLG